MCEGLDFDGYYHEALFLKQSTIVLETIACPYYYNFMFDVSNISGQERLKKFLAFIKHPRGGRGVHALVTLSTTNIVSHP